MDYSVDRAAYWEMVESYFMKLPPASLIQLMSHDVRFLNDDSAFYVPPLAVPDESSQPYVAELPMSRHSSLLQSITQLDGWDKSN